MISWIRRTLPVVVAGVILAPVALVHTHLTASFPAKDAVLDGSPAKITLTFNARPELAVSDIKVLAADSTPIAVGKVVRCADDSLAITTPLKAPLADGSYQVVWRTGSKDGHPIRGRYSFRVARRTAQ